MAASIPCQGFFGRYYVNNNQGHTCGLVLLRENKLSLFYFDFSGCDFSNFFSMADLDGDHEGDFYSMNEVLEHVSRNPNTTMPEHLR